MAAPLPTDEAIERVLQLNSSAAQRFQALSFFLLVIFGSAWVVQLLWNYLRRDLASMPRLTYGRAVAGVLLWGLLFVVVLTMIAAARELMTPGAWEKQGFTYKLPPPTAAEPDLASRRKQHLERLRTALWHFAATHQGRFPTVSETNQIPDELWFVPEGGGLRYRYFDGLSADRPATLLVCEPELDPSNRLALRTNGDIGPVRAADARETQTKEGTP
jgi:hypothetical protein